MPCSRGFGNFRGVEEGGGGGADRLDNAITFHLGKFKSGGEGERNLYP